MPREPRPRDMDLERDLRKQLTGVLDTVMAEQPAQGLAWDWGEGVLVYGIETAFQVTGDLRYANYVREYLATRLELGVEVGWSDDATPALAVAERVRLGDVQFRPLLQQVVDYLETAPRTPANGVLMHLGHSGWRLLFPDAWVDSLFHVVPTLIRMSQITGNPRHQNEAVRQLLLFLRALQDPKTHLCTHAFDDRFPVRRVPPFDSQMFWARGNGWMLVTLVDALVELPTKHAARRELLLGTQRLEAALRRHQDASGLFHTLVMDPQSYLETAGSGLIVAAMARGARHGVFSADTKAAARNGARGLMAVVEHHAGRSVVTGTSLGTNPMRGSYGSMATADQISYGIGAWLLAASEVLELITQPARVRSEHWDRSDSNAG